MPTPTPTEAVPGRGWSNGRGYEAEVLKVCPACRHSLSSPCVSCAAAWRIPNFNVLYHFKRYHFALPMKSIHWLIFVAAALLEVGGDALVRKGLRGSGILLIVAGMLGLGVYGLVVNLVQWDFSRLLGVYVAVFALISVLFGKFVFAEQVPPATWIGLAVIILGGMIIQFGSAH